MFQIDLIRHGRTKGNEERRYVGRTDEGLSPAGRLELCKIREYLDGAERGGDNLDSEKRACSGNDPDGKKWECSGSDLDSEKHECSRGGRYRRSTRQNALPDVVFQSPLRRCQESADILFPGIPQLIIPEFRETDFGDFEYHTYEELKDDTAYRAWIASGGRTGCPGGESTDQVKTRIQAGWGILCRKMKRRMTKYHMTDDMKAMCREVAQNTESGKVKSGYDIADSVMPDRDTRIYRGEGGNGSDGGALHSCVLLAHGGTIMELLSRYGEPKKDYYDWQTACGHGYRCLWDDRTKRLLVQGVWPPTGERKEEKQHL